MTCVKSRLEWIFFTAACAFVLFSYNASPTGGGLLGSDQSIFVYFSRAVMRGAVPYADVFDHKGPFLYLLDSAGLAIGGALGIWILEGILFIAGALVLHRTVRSVAGRVGAVAFDFFYALHVALTSEGGNLVETWAAPLVCLVLAAMIRALRDGRWRLADAAAAGAALSAIFFTRLNMCSIGIAYFLCAAWDSWRNRSPALFLRVAGAAFAGAAVVALPVLAWLAWKGAIAATFDGYILFNFKYMKANEPGAFDVYAVASTVDLALLLALGALTCRGDARLKRIFPWTAFAACLCLGVALLKPTYLHYFCVCAPAVAVLAAFAVPHAVASGLAFRLAAAAAVFHFMFFPCRGFIHAFSRVDSFRPIVAERGLKMLLPHNLFRLRAEAIEKRRAGIMEIGCLLDLKDESDRNSVTVLQNECEIYELLGVRTPWRYPFQSTLVVASDEIREEVIAAIRSRSSRYIVCNKSHVPRIDRCIWRELRACYCLKVETARHLIFERNAQGD